MQKNHNRLYDMARWLCFQCADVRDREGVMGSEQLPWACITRDTQCPHGKARVCQEALQPRSLGL